MSSSSSEEEVDDAFKESAGCDYITQMVTHPRKPNATDSASDKPECDAHSLRSNRVNDDRADQFRVTGFEKFIAARLVNRLDDTIKIVEKKRATPADSGETTNAGIRLFSGSAKVTELIEASNEQSPSSRKRVRPPDVSVDYSGRAEEAAVSAEWVADPSNTAFWKDNKKPRVISAKVVKNLPSGGLECVPLSNN